jgi:tRNA G18 (ribose-2'-O)-methylase SpoU
MGKISRLNPLLEALKTPSCRIQKILFQKDSAKRKVGDIIIQAKSRGIPCSFVSKETLDKMDPHHQGMVATVAEKKIREWSPLLQKRKCLHSKRL